MTRTTALASCATALAVLGLQMAPALAEDYGQYPGATPGYPFQRSSLTGWSARIRPYHRLFPVRVYTTPPQGPYYNVPPYTVIAPF